MVVTAEGDATVWSKAPKSQSTKSLGPHHQRAHIIYRVNPKAYIESLCNVSDLRKQLILELIMNQETDRYKFTKFV